MLLWEVWGSRGGSRVLGLWGEFETEHSQFEGLGLGVGCPHYTIVTIRNPRNSIGNYLSPHGIPYILPTLAPSLSRAVGIALPDAHVRRYVSLRSLSPELAAANNLVSTHGAVYT